MAAFSFLVTRDDDSIEVRRGEVVTVSFAEGLVRCGRRRIWTTFGWLSQLCYLGVLVWLPEYDATDFPPRDRPSLRLIA